MYAAHNPAFVPNSASIASIFFPFLGMLDSATLTIDVAGVELAAPSPAFAVDINGVGIAFPVVGSFNQSSVLAYSLTGSMLAAANAAGEVVLTIDRNGSPDWIAFDYFALNGETVSPVPIPAAAWLFASALGVFGYLGKRKANA